MCLFVFNLLFMSYLNWHFPHFFWFRSLRWCGAGVASNRRRSVLEVQTAGDTDQELQGDSQNQVRRPLRSHKEGSCLISCKSDRCRLKRSLEDSPVDGRMVMAIGLDESLLATQNTTKTLDGWSWWMPNKLDAVEPTDSDWLEPRRGASEWKLSWPVAYTVMWTLCSTTVAEWLKTLYKIYLVFLLSGWSCNKWLTPTRWNRCICGGLFFCFFF